MHARWAGKCEACGEWNTIVEEGPRRRHRRRTGLGGAQGPRAVALVPLDGEIEDAPRISTRVSELDRVTGGGFVRGSALLVGGDPGIGKSTLLMQAAAHFAGTGLDTLYVSGEEAVAAGPPAGPAARRRRQPVVLLAAETNVEDILATLADGKRPDLVIIDSIQTLWTDIAESAPGTVTQVRASAQAMIRYAKQTGAAIVLVGHVTKDGQIAGPRVVEHMVDAVLYFEGERGHHFRILRAVKNRFGPADEIGVFEMSDRGPARSRQSVGAVSRRTQRQGAGRGRFRRHGRHAAGAGRDPGAGGALDARHAAPRRRRLGQPRLSMVLAVLEAHCGVRFGSHDVYLNVAGGYRITEPAADLAVAAALVSSLAGLALPADCVYFGEISLSGAVRPVAHAGQRLKEAEKLGFARRSLPSGSKKCRSG